MAYHVRQTHRHHLSVTLLGFLLAAGAIGEEPTKRFERTVMTEAMRSYYPQLTDSEYASLKPGPQLFPLLFPQLAEGPLSTELIMGYDRPEYAEDSAVRLQTPLIEAGVAPSIRSQAFRELADSHSPLGIETLLERLPQEPDPKLVADILRCLADRQQRGIADRVMPLLDSPSDSVRYGAYRLLSIQDELDADAVLERLTSEKPSLAVQALAWLAPHAETTSLASWAPFWEADNPEIQQAALAGMLRLPDANTYRDSLLEQASEGPPALRHSLGHQLHKGLDPDFSGEVISLLAADELSVLRTAAADACARLALPSLETTLIELSRDPRPEVRLSAARAWRAYPTKVGMDTLVQLGGDTDSKPVREAARDSLVLLAEAFPVLDHLPGALTAPEPHIRRSAYIVSHRLASARHLEQIAGQLEQETAPANIEQAIRALSVGNYRQGRELILSFAERPDSGVRTAIAEAIGSLELSDGYDWLGRYVLGNDPQPVKSAAIRSMGNLAQSSFAAPLLAVLKRTNSSSIDYSTDTDRILACWAISQLPAPPREALARLQALVSTPVIQTEMGPEFDSDAVRVSATWALVDLADRERTPELIEMAQETIEVLRMPEPDPRSMTGGSMPPPTSDMLRAYGLQAAQFLAGDTITRTPVPLGTYRFSFIAYEK